MKGGKQKLTFTNKNPVETVQFKQMEMITFCLAQIR